MNTFSVGEVAYIWVIYGKIDFWASVTTEENRQKYVKNLNDRRVANSNNYLGLAKIKIKDLNPYRDGSAFVGFDFLDKRFASKFSSPICTIDTVIKPCAWCKKEHDQ